jgi:plasmid maintenance system antidote protein VapI
MYYRYQKKNTVNRKLKTQIILKFGAQYPFAAAMGIQKATVSAVVQEHLTLAPESQRRWARALGTSVEQLFP